MKEASGEANMTVITILLIAIVGAVGTVIINNLMKTSKDKADCAENGGVWTNGACSTIKDTNNLVPSNPKPDK